MKVFEPKLLTCFKGYTKKQLVSDVVAGIIVAIIALPLSIALAIASNVAPEKGLYTAIVAGFIISLLGGSRVNISGPTAAFATIVAGIVADKGLDGLTIATLMAGLMLIIMGVCKLGTLIKYVPKTITVGFTGGIAVTIVIGQLKDFLGITFPENFNPVESIEKLHGIISNISTFEILALVVGVVSLAILIVWPKISKKIPGSLIVVLIGGVLFAVLRSLSVEIPVKTIGDLYKLNSGLPPFSFPKLNFQLILELFPDALTIAILAGIESLLSCVVSDGMINDTHNPNTELIAQGLGNLGSGLFGGIPATGAIARTAANVRNGGRTPISGIVHAVVLLLVLIILMPYAAYIPMPIIASILFIVAYNMSEWRSFVKIFKSKDIADDIILIATFILTIVYDLVVAIVAGLILHYIIVTVKKIKNNKKQVEKTTSNTNEIESYVDVSVVDEVAISDIVESVDVNNDKN